MYSIFIIQVFGEVWARFDLGAVQYARSVK
jgi:hypothetical protein